MAANVAQPGIYAPVEGKENPPGSMATWKHGHLEVIHLFG